MFIEVNKIPPEGLAIDQALILPPIVQAGGEPASIGQTRVTGIFGRSRGDFIFRGKVEATLSLTCSRCAAPFLHPASSACYRIYRPGPLTRVGPKGEVDAEDLALTPFDGLRIDLSELAQEQIYLMVPLKPLCRETCGGLCPRCGANRNVAPCGCPEDLQGPEPLTLKLPI